jgi:large subunit ribosomal protein L1
MDEKKFLSAIKKLRDTEKKVNFDQTVDLLVNLKNFDVRKQAFNLFVPVPHKIKDKKIAGFLEKDSKIVDAINKENFGKFKEKKEIKKLLKTYDFFIANAKLMPAVATSFGRFLGPAGKMPSPQLGIVPVETDDAIKNVVDKINSTVRVRVKEPSIKLGIGKESMSDEELMENAVLVYHKILEALPRKIDNLKNIMVKFSMDKPVRVE